VPVRLGLEFVWIPAPTIVANAYFAAAEAARTLEIPMEEATEIIATEIDLNFEMEGRPEHWAPLSAATMHQRVMGTISGGGGLETFRLGTSEWQAQIFGAFAGSMKILTRTGTLRMGATEPRSWEVSSSGQTTIATLYDPTGYGHYHLTGTSIMPVRDYTYISEEAQEEIGELFLDYIEEAWEGAW